MKRRSNLHAGPYYCAVVAALVEPGTVAQIAERMGLPHDPDSGYEAVRRALRIMRGRICHISGYVRLHSFDTAVWSLGVGEEPPVPRCMKVRKPAGPPKRVHEAMAFTAMFEAMMLAPHSAMELVPICGLTKQTVRRLLGILRASRVIRVAAWDRKHTFGAYTAHYEVAPGRANVPKPPRITRSEAVARYRVRMLQKKRDLQIHRALAGNNDQFALRA